MMILLPITVMVTGLLGPVRSLRFASSLSFFGSACWAVKDSPDAGPNAKRQAALPSGGCAGGGGSGGFAGVAAENAIQRGGEPVGVPIDGNDLGDRAAFGSLLDQLGDLDQILGVGVDQDGAAPRRRDAERTAVLEGFL